MVKIVIFVILSLVILIAIYLIFRTKGKSCTACTDTETCVDGACVSKTCPKCGKDQICDPNKGECIYPCGIRPSTSSECKVEDLICSDGEWKCPNLCGPYPSNSGECDTFTDLYCDPSLKKWVCIKGCDNGGIDHLDGKGCICTSSFYGNKCQYQTPICDNHGIYDGTKDVCVCNTDNRGDPYTGKFCSDGSDTKCNNHGSWNGTICTCDKGYTGTDCSELQCENGTSSNNICVCNPGWQGSLCDTEIPNYCQNGGTFNGSTCECPSNWEGVTCQNPFTENCNHGSLSGIKCVCNPGWQGDVCDTEIPNYCQNGTFNGTECVCSDGWQGITCSVKKLDCGTNGTNKDDGTCKCNTGYIGNECEFQITDCNGGIPTVTNDTLTCDCSVLSKTVGDRCQFGPKYCSGNGTPITDGEHLEGCTCDPGYMGSLCQCSNNFCNNGGTVSLEGDACICTCDSNHQGSRCQCDKTKKINCGICDLTEPTCDENCNSDCYKCGPMTECPDAKDLIDQCNSKCNTDEIPSCSIVNGIAAFSCSNKCVNPSTDDANACIKTSTPDNPTNYICNSTTNWEWQCTPTIKGSDVVQCPDNFKPRCLSLNYVNGEYQYDTDSTLAQCITYPNYCNPDGSNSSDCDQSQYMWQWYCPGTPKPFGYLIDENKINPIPSKINTTNNNQENVWFSTGDEISSIPVYPVIKNANCETGQSSTISLSAQDDYNTIYGSNLWPQGNLVTNNNIYTFIPYDTINNIYYDV